MESGVLLCWFRDILVGTGIAFLFQDLTCSCGDVNFGDGVWNLDWRVFWWDCIRLKELMYDEDDGSERSERSGT
jgi:hypothetical protein